MTLRLKNKAPSTTDPAGGRALPARRLVAAFTLLFVLASPANEAENQLVFSSIENFPDTATGELVLAEAYRRLGIDIRIKHFPGAKALQQSNSGQVDGEVGRIDGASKKFKNLVQISIPISYMQGAVFSKDPDLRLVGWHSLRPYRVGRVKGVLFSEQGTRGMNTVEAENYSDLINMLEQDQVDVVVAPYLNGLIAIRDHPNGNNLKLNGVLESYLLYHYLHSKHCDMIPAIQKVLKVMLKDGTTTDIRNKFVAELTAGAKE